MKKSEKFLKNYYDKAIKLNNDFSITRSFEWTPLLILNELHIQVGHIYNIVYKSEAVNEKNRDFNDMGDEISDVFLQLIALSDSMNIDLYHIEKLKKLKEENWLSLPILLGQLNESIMEKYGYRFPKERVGFKTLDLFIENRILRIFDITCQIAEKYNLDIEKEFDKMLKDANNFLNNFSLKYTPKNFIDTYNENHDYIGSFEKDKAHQLLLWHDVVGCMIFNPNSKKIYFQLKNHKHNNVNKKDLLEITTGGHLKSGETQSGLLREMEEETGIIATADQLIFCEARKCDRDNNMIIREFQKYYILPLDIYLKDFCPKDIEEIVGIVEIDFKDAMSAIYNNKTINAKIIKDNNIADITINKSNFDAAYINNGIFTMLLQNIIDYEKGCDK